MSSTAQSLESDAAPRKPVLRLAVFDLDGTLKEAFSPWMYLHEALGVAGQAKPYRERFFSGEIDYLEWARLDAALWAGVELAHVEAVFQGSPFRSGVRELFRWLASHGVRSAIISTGLDVHARQVAATLGVWRTVSNELVVRNGRLTGEAIVHVAEGAKGMAMAKLRAEAGAGVEECLAVGDGPSDVQLFDQAGLSVAVCPRDHLVRQAAHVVLEQGNLEAVIPHLAGHFVFSSR